MNATKLAADIKAGDKFWTPTRRERVWALEDAKLSWTGAYEISYETVDRNSVGSLITNADTNLFIA